MAVQRARLRPYPFDISIGKDCCEALPAELAVFGAAMRQGIDEADRAGDKGMPVDNLLGSRFRLHFFARTWKNSPLKEKVGRRRLMERGNTRGRPLSLLLSRGRKPSREALFETFHAQTFRHLDAIYSDAFCLTGLQEDAADLVVEAYLRAFENYPQFQRRHAPEHLQPHCTRTWLYGKMHEAFCDAVLAGTGYSRTPNSKAHTGGRR